MMLVGNVVGRAGYMNFYNATNAFNDFNVSVFHTSLLQHFRSIYRHLSDAQFVIFLHFLSQKTYNNFE